MTPDIGAPIPTAPPPTLDAVLAWLGGLEESGQGSAILADGGAIMNEALSEFGEDHREAGARRVLDLHGSQLMTFVDVAATIGQMSDADRLGMASDFRLTVAGRDRLQPRGVPATTITQIVHAAQAQVAGGDITNYVSFSQLLDRVEQAVDEVDDVDEETRAEARGLLDKLRAASGTVATGTASGAGGALLGAVLKQVLGLP